MKKHSIHQNYIFILIPAFLVYYLALASFFPYLRVFSLYILSLFVAAFLWLVHVLLIRPKFWIKSKFHTIILVIFICYSFVVPYLFNNSTIGNRYLETSGLMFVFYIAYRYYSQYGLNTISKKIIKWTLPFIVYTTVVTFFGLTNNAFLARSIKARGDNTLYLRSQGIGGYEFIYFLVLVSIIIFYILLNLEQSYFDKKQRIAFVLILTLFIATILLSNYFTALLMLLISFSIILLLRIKKFAWKVIFAPVALLGTVFYRTIFIEISNWIIKLIGKGLTTDRLLVMQENVLGSGANESIAGVRLSTLQSSLDALFSNPIAGIVSTPMSVIDKRVFGFGQHSYFLDTFALFGFVMGIVNIYLVTQPFLLRMKNKKLIGLNLAFFVSLMILFTMNNTTPSIGYVAFFLYPVTYDQLTKKTLKNVS